MLGGCVAENNIDVSNAGLIARVNRCHRTGPRNGSSCWMARWKRRYGMHDGLVMALEEAGVAVTSLDQTVYSFLFGNNR